MDIRSNTLDILSRSYITKKSKFYQHEVVATSDSTVEDIDLMDVYSSDKDTSLVQIFKANESLKPFTGFGSFRQRNGDFQWSWTNGAGPLTRKRGMSSEAPAKLGTGLCKNNLDRHGYFTTDSILSNSSLPNEIHASLHDEPIVIKNHQAMKETVVSKGLQKQRSVSTDMDREEAWERKRDLFFIDELQGFYDNKNLRNVGRCSSDCGDRTRPRGTSIPRTRSLTDEDLEELRGCIDLGFGFSYDKSCDLRSTLPALDLYCAINRQYRDMKTRSSPVSPLDGVKLERSSSVDSVSSPLSDTWRISSPGDHPNQVKTRLRHWAQAVACSVRQGSF